MSIYDEIENAVDSICDSYAVLDNGRRFTYTQPLDESVESCDVERMGIEFTLTMDSVHYEGAVITYSYMVETNKCIDEEVVRQISVEDVDCFTDVTEGCICRGISTEVDNYSACDCIMRKNDELKEDLKEIIKYLHSLD